MHQLLATGGRCGGHWPVEDAHWCLRTATQAVPKGFEGSIAPRLAFRISVHVIEISWSQVTALWMSERPRYASHASSSDRCDYWGNGQPNHVKRLVGVQQLAVIDFRLDEQDQNLRMT